MWYCVEQKLFPICANVAYETFQSRVITQSGPHVTHLLRNKVHISPSSKPFCTIHIFRSISWHSARCCYLWCRPVLLALSVKLGRRMCSKWCQFKVIIVQWWWWKVAQCLPTRDKALLFPLEGNDHSHTEAESHTQPGARWDSFPYESQHFSE